MRAPQIGKLAWTPTLASFTREDWPESGDMAERMINVGGVELCTEPFGDPAGI
jgi:hypothetical protein